jgi:hypothetical protein
MANELLALLGSAGTVTPASDILYIEQSSVGKKITVQSLVDKRGMRVYNILEYGAVAGSDSTVAIQAAMDAAGTAGGGVVFCPANASAYLLQVAGDNPYHGTYKYCLKFNYDHVILWIERGAKLMLAGSQQVDGAAVDMITWSDKTEVGICGGGTIDGNSTNQAGWTGGYATNYGNILWIYATAGNGNYDNVLEDLTLTNHFGDAIFMVSSDNSSIHYRLYVDHLTAMYPLGEGIDFGCTKDSVIRNVAVFADANMIGDGLEVSTAVNTKISGVTIKDVPGPNSSIDLYNSSDIELTDFIVDGDYLGIDVVGNATHSNVMIRNGIIKNCSSAGINIQYTSLNVTLENVILDTTVSGIFICNGGTKHPGPVRINNCQLLNMTGNGIYALAAIKNFMVTNCQFQNIDTWGIYIATAGASADDDVEGYLISGNSFDDVVNNNIIVESYSTYYPIGYIGGCSFTNAGARKIGGTAALSLSRMKIGDNYPNFERIAPDSYQIPELKIVEPAGNFATIQEPSYYQTILFKAYKDTTVIDKTESGGNNISLVGDTNFVMAAGNYLCLLFDGTDWIELWRK